MHQAPLNGPPDRPAASSAPADAALRGSFWTLPVAEVLARLAATPDGLTSPEAALRARRYGPNRLVEAPRHSLAVQFLARFANPLILLLLAASAVSAATGDRASFAIITGVILLSVVLDFVQEARAGRAVDRLRASVAVRATVARDGENRELPSGELVPGDVITLSAGDLVPADSQLLTGRDVYVAEAGLTGEPFPVAKQPGAAAGASQTEATNAVFMGSSVVSGTARAVVVRTGRRTLLGAVGASLAAPAPPAAFEVGLRRFGGLILRLAIGMVLFVLLVNAWFHRPWLESFLFAVALAVGLTPELLPMVLSVTLARGAMRMARRKVIVKRLAAIHDLGSMSVLCTDKTGTLTEARIRLERHVDLAGRDSARVLQLVYLNSRFDTGLRTPMDEAVLRHTEVAVDGWAKLDEVPFDFERRRVSVLVRDPAGAALLIVKGAADELLARCGWYEAAGGERSALDESSRARATALMEQLAGEGFRVLAVAWRELGGATVCRADDETGLVLAGLAAFEDPPKSGAGDALRALAEYGVSVKVVTGDNELVTRHLCGELGIAVGEALSGAEVELLTDDALMIRSRKATLFCRVSPMQKNRVIRALQRSGEVVGYLGDGINDAPSLRSADVGISVQDAADVARQAADLILLEQDLGVLRDGVLEGRRTYANVLKYILMGTSSNFGNMFSMAAATLVLPFLPMLPVQILLNNLLYDISELPIPGDRVDPELVDRPRRWDLGLIRRFMLVVGPVSSLFDFLTFFVLLEVLHAGVAAFRTGWFVESLASQVLVIFVIRTRGRPWASRPGTGLVVAAAMVIAVALILPATPIGGRFGLVAPPAQFLPLLGGILVMYLGAVELVKRSFYRRTEAPVPDQP